MCIFFFFQLQDYGLFDLKFLMLPSFVSMSVHLSVFRLGFNEELFVINIRLVAVLFCCIFNNFNCSL